MNLETRSKLEEVRRLLTGPGLPDGYAITEAVIALLDRAISEDSALKDLAEKAQSEAQISPPVAGGGR